MAKKFYRDDILGSIGKFDAPKDRAGDSPQPFYLIRKERQKARAEIRKSKGNLACEQMIIVNEHGKARFEY